MALSCSEVDGRLAKLDSQNGSEACQGSTLRFSARGAKAC